MLVIDSNHMETWELKTSTYIKKYQGVVYLRKKGVSVRSLHDWIQILGHGPYLTKRAKWKYKSLQVRVYGWDLATMTRPNLGICVSFGPFICFSSRNLHDSTGKRSENDTQRHTNSIIITVCWMLLYSKFQGRRKHARTQKGLQVKHFESKRVKGSP